MIGLIDAKSGNIGSVVNALDQLNLQYSIITKKDQFKSNMKLILPGVGSFYRLMKNLEKLDLLVVLKDMISQGTPYLGICVGMQVLFSVGLEDKQSEGLGILKGRVIKFTKKPEAKIPLISWIKVETPKDSEKNLILQNCGEMNFYFLHSYFCEVEDQKCIVAYSKYDNEKYAAIVNKDNIYGVQFHPEKSRESGLQLLKNFSKIN
tara:strand:+ start:328 stop:945 length:618 start_codon:yes stop_codon:yes gene_type:complete